MKEKMWDKFLLSNYCQTVFQKFQNLKQNNKIVDEYTDDFYKLQAQNNEDEEQSVASYINGLHYFIQEVTSL